MTSEPPNGEPTVVGGRYELGELLGRGGMAEVHRARDIRLGRPVAVKQLRVDLAGDSTFQARFRREAQAAAGLNHPNIVSVYDTGEEPDPATGVQVPYIVMELVEGKTLRAVLRDGRKILPERALELTAGVLDALSYSHRAGIVHRDIKPANVMLTPSGDVKVMDFGIARAVADTSATMTQTAAVIGTAQYLSPEQARGEKVDARSDLYSAGCLLYELLVGRPPFVGETPVSVAYQHVRETPAPPSELDPEISPGIDAITLKSLAKHPGDRYQTAREMKHDITRLLAGEDVTTVIPETAPAPPPTQVVPAAVPAAVEEEPEQQTLINTTDGDRPEKKHTAAAVVLIVLIVLALAAVGGVAYYLLNSSPPSNSPTQSASPPNVKAVPDVTGWSQTDAESRLRQDGFIPIAKTVHGKDDNTVGTVVKQDPKGDAQATVGSEVTISVNQGPKTGTIPVNLVGQKLDDVTKALKKAGFTNVHTEKSHNEPKDAQKDEVLDISPSQGSTDVPLDTRITVVYATGEVTVPDWKGKSRAFVESDSVNKGIVVTFEPEVSPDANPGTVLKTDPSAGTTIDKGETVTVTIAREPSTPPSTPSSGTPSTPSGEESTPDSTPSSPSSGPS